VLPYTAHERTRSTSATAAVSLHCAYTYCALLSSTLLLLLSLQAMGMKLLYKRSNVPNDPSMLARLGYGTEADSTVLELVYKYSQEKASDAPTYILL
jgi:hypothetical protein